MKIRVVDSIAEFKSYFGLQRDGVLLEPDLDEIETDCDVDSRKRRDAEVLCTLAANSPTSVLELGTSHGRGAYKLATNLQPGLTVFTVNLLPEQYDTSGGKMITHLMTEDMIGAYFRERGITNVQQIYANTAKWNMPLDLREFGMVFVDAAHDEALVASDTKLVWPRVADNGFIVWHDFTPFLRQKHDWIEASMRGAERFLKEHGLEECEVVYLRNSWCGVLRKEVVPHSSANGMPAEKRGRIEIATSSPLTTERPNFRYAVVYPAYSEARMKEEELFASEARKLGYDVEALPIFCPGGWWHFPKLDAKWRERSAELMPQYEALEEQLRKKDVVIASGGPMLHPEFVRRLSTFNVWICGDDPESSEVLSRPAAPAFDYSFPINVACLEDYKRWGCERVDWIFHPIRAEMRAPELTEEAILSGQRDFDIVMFCERVLGLSDRAQRLEALSSAFPKAYLRGKGWPGGFISDAAMRDVYSRAKIGWNLHNSIGPCNTRLVTLPAFGIMQICDNKNHLGKVFELDKEVVGFDSIDECIDKTRYYLEHDEERRKIAAAGWARATRDYTWPKWWEWLETRIAGPAQAKLAKGGRKLSAMVPRLQPTRKLVENVTESISVSSKPEVVPVSKADLTPAPVATIPDLPVLAPDGTRPRVLMLVDKRGWAYDTAAQAISKRLADEFEFRIEYVREQPDLNAWPFDLIYVFFWGETYHQKFVKDPNRVIKEISSHRWANEDQYGRLTAEQAAQRYLSDAGTLTATSHRLRDIFSPYREVHWCPNGFEPANFQAPPLRTGPLRIGWAGNENDPCKGLKDVLKPAAGKDFELVIAGGDLDAARMGQFYNQIDVLCIASTAEGEPLTLVEGLASGCFPVSVDVGIVPELVHHGRNGLTVNRNAAAFQSAFQWCQLNVGEVRRAGEENARTMLTTRRWDDVSIHWRRALRSAYRRYSADRLSGSGKSGGADDKAFFERNLGVQLGQWPERAQAAAALIGRLGWGVGASVIDMGCGHQTLKGLISPSIQYVPVDRIARTPEVTVIDFNERLPEGGYTVATLLGVIEYFAQPERLLGWAAKHCQHLVLSYNDCSNPARRERQHWKSTLGFQELEAMLTRLGGRITERHDLGRAELIYSISFAPAARVTKKLALFSAGVNGDNSGDALIVDAIQRLLAPQAMEIFPLLEPLSEAQIDRINACDMGVICGTNLYQHDFHCELTPRVIEKIRVPILPLGIGTSAPIGLLPRMNAEGVRAVQMIHERCEVGSVRDPISLKFVESLGIKNVALTGCPVLFHALKEPVFEEASTDRLVVAVRARLLHVEEHWGAKQRHTLERLCREFRPALVLQSPYDVPIAEELAARFQLPILHDPRYTAKPMLEGVHRASRTIGFRLHFGMLTLAYGKPATLIATDTRTSEFCDMMGVAWHDIHSYKDESLIKELHEPQPGHERFLTRWRELRHAMKSALSANGLDTALE